MPQPLFVEVSSPAFAVGARYLERPRGLVSVCVRCAQGLDVSKQ
jgi:hypothetical protein